MKFKQLLLAASLSIVAASCFNDDDLWNKVNEQDQRIAALETWQKQANTNISSIQSLLDGVDYVTDVKPLMEDGVQVGYTISFAQKEAINIYNGVNGAEMPVVGVQQAEDGVYYWTLNGEPMKDASGALLRASGPKGPQGTPGVQAPTPQVKTGQALTDAQVPGSWIADSIYLSIDNGATWTKVTGDKGDNGEPYFKSVDATTNDEYVVFTLQDDTQVLAPKYQNVNLNFKLNGTPIADFTGDLALTFGDVITCEVAGSSVTEANKAEFHLAVTTDDAAWKPKVGTDNTISFKDAGFDNCMMTVVVTNNKGLARTYALSLTNKDLDWYLNPVSADTYSIATEGELYAFARLTNGVNLPATMPTDDFTGKTVKMANDIEISNRDYWTPIGVFFGNFDGQNHSIKGTLRYPTAFKLGGITGAGFFNGVAGVVQNLKMEATILGLEEQAQFGGIVNLIADGGVVRNCINRSDIHATYSVGGVVCESLGNALVEACVNLGNIESSVSNVGGVVYRAVGNVVGCINKGALKGEGETSSVSGIVDVLNKATVACWSSSPSLDASKVGAIAGRGVTGGVISNCYWKTLPNASTPGDSFNKWENCAAFDTDTPPANYIANMNAAWAALIPGRTFQFNATTGEVEPIAQN